MKRLIPAAIIFVFVTVVCVCSQIYVKHACEQTIKDIENYHNNNITAAQLEVRWQNRKENMAIFVNHGFLDKISLYTGQLTVASDNNSHEFNTVYKNIMSVLSLIKAEQKFGLHSFY